MSQKIFRICLFTMTVIILGYCIYILRDIYAKQSPYKEVALPFYGPKGDSTGKYHVPDFTFVNQDSEKVTLQNFKNKVWVTDFFFTTCEGICPIMKKNLKSVLDSFSNEPDFLILSHTVQPEHDSVKVLKAFSEQYGQVANKWHFVTGEKLDLYNQARYAYFIAEPTDASIQEDFVHSQLLALIDRAGRIRGYYDGTSETDKNRLVKDIRLLLK
ncbi:MAG: SCO family protein [Bacteroidetes bacterium]|nr:SCO family protein [Bacteroidota bacterium]